MSFQSVVSVFPTFSYLTYQNYSILSAILQTIKSRLSQVNWISEPENITTKDFPKMHECRILIGPLMVMAMVMVWNEFFRWEMWAGALLRLAQANFMESVPKKKIQVTLSHTLKYYSF